MMQSRLRNTGRSSLGKIVSTSILGLSLGAALAMPSAGRAQSASSNPQLQADVMKSLSGKRFASVSASVDGSTVVLNGTVPTYADKLDAERKTHHRKGVKAVDNEIRVAGAEVTDAQLQQKLAGKIAYARVGYGTTAFNSIAIGVHDGVVTLGGTAYGPTDKSDFLSIVENEPGVRDVVDDIQVAPLSNFDDRIRIEEARAIYGFPTLQRYAINPVKPIRIIVVNGHVTLSGVVDSKADKDAAGIRANGVSGVFSVENDLQVEESSKGN
jgi:hyperosmotically inducible protein